MNVSGAVLRLWKAVPREVRLSFERHPVDDVRTLEAERDQLRRELERRESGVYGEMRDELVAELEKLEAERDQLREERRLSLEEREELLSERDRYRAALETIRDRRTDKGVPFYHDAERSIAAAALDPTEAPNGLTPRQRAGLDPAESDWTGDPTEAPEPSPRHEGSRQPWRPGSIVDPTGEN